MVCVGSNRRPWHPLVVYFPLALLGMSFVFDVLSLRLGPAMVEAARYNVTAGLVAAAICALAGIRDYFVILPRKSAMRGLARYHGALNLLATALFAVGLMHRWRLRGALVTPPWPFVLSALGVVVLGVAGYLGGVIVLNAGIDLDSRRPPDATS